MCSGSNLEGFCAVCLLHPREVAWATGRCRFCGSCRFPVCARPGSGPAEVLDVSVRGPRAIIFRRLTRIPLVCGLEWPSDCCPAPPGCLLPVCSEVSAPACSPACPSPRPGPPFHREASSSRRTSPAGRSSPTALGCLDGRSDCCAALFPVDTVCEITPGAEVTWVGWHGWWW